MENSSRRYGGLVQGLRSLLRARAVSNVDALLRTIAEMRDPRKAAAFLGDWLRHLPPEAIAATLDAILERAEGKERGGDLALQAMLCPELKSSWAEGLGRRVAQVARREKRFDLAAMLLEMPEPDIRFDPPVGKTARELAKIPLGVRKSWARRTDAFLLDRLLSDPDETVIANLLDNPRLTVREVINLAASKAAREEVLEMIALHPRWITQYRVKLTLAYNPSTPVRITLGLLRMLLKGDLEALSRDSRLSEVVLRRAEKMLHRRNRAGIVTGPDAGHV